MIDSCAPATGVFESQQVWPVCCRCGTSSRRGDASDGATVPTHGAACCGPVISAPVKVVRIVLYIMHDARTAPIAHSRVSAHLSPVLRSHDTEPHHGATLTHNVHSTGTVGECDERPRRHCRLAQRSLTVRSKPHQTRPRACCCATTALHTSCLSAFARCLLLTLRTLQRVKATVRCVHRGRPGSP